MTPLVLLLPVAAIRIRTTKAKPSFPMNLVAICPARNEGWILGLTARAALLYCDSIVIFNHASTDDTAEIIDGLIKEFPSRVNLIESSDPEWREMEHRQCLLDFARAIGATHIANVDADEILAGDLLPTIRGHIERLQPGTFLGIPMKNLHRSIAEYRADPSPFGSMAGTMLAFADAPNLGWAAKNGYDHHSRAPQGSRMGNILSTDGGLMHLQFASWRRLVAKHKAYRILERLKYPGKRVEDIERLYSQATDESGLKLRPVPSSWWQPYEHLMGYLDLDREPWQEGYVRRAVAEHGSAHFAGLNLIGLA